MDFNHLSIMQKSVSLGIRKEIKIGGGEGESND